LLWKEAVEKEVGVANNAEANAMEKSRAAATGLKCANDQEADIGTSQCQPETTIIDTLR
jgi:hypothetical protein